MCSNSNIDGYWASCVDRRCLTTHDASLPADEDSRLSCCRSARNGRLSSVKYEEQSGYSRVALEKVIMTMMMNCVPELLAM